MHTQDLSGSISKDFSSQPFEGCGVDFPHAGNSTTELLAICCVHEGLQASPKEPGSALK